MTTHNAGHFAPPLPPLAQRWSESYDAAIRRARMMDRYFIWLCLVLLGYALGGRGFAYWGVNPLFVGEVSLLIGLFILVRSNVMGRVLRIRAFIPLMMFMAWGAICTIPLTAGGQVLGALVLELPVGSEFDAHTVELCEHAALLVGPVLDVKRKEDRWLGQKAWDSAALYARRLVGPRHVALKLWTGLAALLLAFFLFAKGDFRITSDAILAEAGGDR